MPVSRHGAISAIGRRRSTAALALASGCRRTGNRRARQPVSERGWKRPFDDPVPLPRGRRLVTLQDAAEYIMALPEAEHDAVEWQAAMEALLLVAEHGGPVRASELCWH